MRVLLVLVLGCSLAGGRLVDKCELKAQMTEAAEGNQKGLAAQDFVAKIVCAAELGSGFSTDVVNETKPRMGEQPWRFYGLFQLGDRLACSDGATSSPNVCRMDCQSFLDDDIDDDLRCLLEIFTNLLDGGFNAKHYKELETMITFILKGDCKTKTASDYFTDCGA